MPIGYEEGEFYGCYAFTLLVLCLSSLINLGEKGTQMAILYLALHISILPSCSNHGRNNPHWRAASSFIPRAHAVLSQTSLVHCPWLMVLLLLTGPLMSLPWCCFLGWKISSPSAAISTASEHADDACYCLSPSSHFKGNSVLSVTFVLPSKGFLWLRDTQMCCFGAFGSLCQNKTKAWGE